MWNGHTMTRLHPLPQHKVIAVLEKNGFREVRRRKHITFKRKTEEKVTVFVLKYIMKQTGKSLDEFFK